MPKMISPETFNFGKLDSYIDMLKESMSKVYAFSHHYYQADVGLKPDMLNHLMESVHSKHGNKPIFMTEYAVLQRNPNDSLGRMLNIGKLMHSALTIEQVSVYMYWGLFWWSEEGLLDLSSPDVINITPEYYAFKHYSAFIHPAWTRIKTSQNLAIDGFFVSSYINPMETKISLVAINTNRREVSSKLEFHDKIILDGTIHQSSATKDCEFSGEFNASTPFKFPALSIVTLSLNIRKQTFCDVCREFNKLCPVCQY